MILNRLCYFDKTFDIAYILLGYINTMKEALFG